MSFPRYPEYKDSGVEWLGKVPAHWEILRLKHVLSQITDRASRRTNPIGLENIEGWSGRFIDSESDFSGDGVAFEKEDLLFGKLRPYLAKVYLANYSGEAVGDFHVMRTSPRVLPKYAFHQLLQRQFISIVDGATHGAKMPRVGWEVMGKMPFATPPKSEQKCIAAFLDHETARIDALVAEQKRLIELLKEKRQAVISHAVTKGLNRDVPMKDSGVEWVGEVPAHWEILPFFSCFAENKRSNRGMLEDNLLSLSYGRIVKKDINTQDGLLPESFETYQIVHVGDIIFRLTDLQNDKRSLRSAIAREQGIITSAYLSVEPIRISPDFSAYLFRSYDRFKVFYAMGGGLRQSMKFGDMKWIPVLRPPESEQKDITNFLDQEIARIDALMVEGESVIKLLLERRAALISAAVTGKIDVRDWRPPANSSAAAEGTEAEPA